jgi:tRNA-specific 2-thiouridylase
LGIPHFAFDRRELFAAEVVAPFVEAYLGGVTPSPCVRCNRGVKTKELFSIAERLGADKVATGHYARIVNGAAGPELHRARDRHKDQSYFLHMLSKQQLSRLLFPLGDATKEEVRAEAVALALPGAHKGESQELCFVPTGRYDAFVDERAGKRVRPGPIVDSQGAEVGRHDGIHRFTVGQRRNLGIALGYKAYVLRIDADSDAVVLGRHEELRNAGARLVEFSLADDLALPLRCEVSVRYHGQGHRALVSRGPHGVEVHFEAEVGAVVPGQYAVLFDAERVLGGGLVAAVLSPSSSAVALEGGSHAPTG